MESFESYNKRVRLGDYCDEQPECSKCMFYGAWCTDYSIHTIPEDMLDFAIDRINKEQEEGSKSNSVDHPRHYNREGAMECIDEMIEVFGKEAVKHFCLCNIWKYRTRCLYKNGEEDMKKSDFYMKKYVELCK